MRSEIRIQVTFIQYDDRIPQNDLIALHFLKTYISMHSVRIFFGKLSLGLVDQR